MATVPGEAGRPAPPRETPAWVDPLASALGEALPRLLGTAADPLLVELIQLLTAALERGEIAVRLAGAAPPWVGAEAWPHGHRLALERSPLAAAPDGPLVLEDDQLAWRRWHERRCTVIAALLARLASPPDLPPLPQTPASPSAPGPARPSPAAPATPGPHRLDPQQEAAVAAVLRQRLVVLQGGPGTGKTSTVVRMLEAVLAREPGCRIQLAAPTGKAAARLRLASGGRHPCGTLHRLLESRGGRFARHRHHLLALDLLVIDEVSMVDLELMAAVLDALPSQARLVLVGDPAQLPPIAPGAPLLELQRPEYRRALAPALVTLGTTHRNNGAIARLAEALREPDGEGDPLPRLRPQLQLLTPADNLRWLEASPPALPEPLLERLRRHQQTLAQLAQACHPDAVDSWRPLLAERDRLLVLTPLRRGRWSVEAIHRSLLGPGAEGGPWAWPLGTPVLCCRNRSEWGLANGDLGVVVAGSPDPLLLFGDGDQPLWLHPAQLAGAVEPALALTVHKAQGSEAAELIVLVGSTQADRRLLYTALTRARQQALLITAAAGES
jgi:exodeoxyribonuclease V alpha subunit